MVVGRLFHGRDRKKRKALFSGLVLPVLFVLGVFSLFGCGDSTTAPAVEVFIESPIVGGFMVGEGAHLRATLSDPSATGTVSWTSSDTAVAWVASDGHIWAQRPGTTTVSATFKKAKADLVVTVVPRPGGYTALNSEFRIHAPDGWKSLMRGTGGVGSGGGDEPLPVPRPPFSVR